MGIERNFNVAFVAEMALREKQIQQNDRPIGAVHKWFVRRAGLRRQVPGKPVRKSLASAPSMARRLSNRNIVCAF